MVQARDFTADDAALCGTVTGIRDGLVAGGYDDQQIAILGFTLIQWMVVAGIRDGVPGVPAFTKRMAHGLLLIADASPTEVEAVRDALVKGEV